MDYKKYVFSSQGIQHVTQSDFSFFNKLYDPSRPDSDDTRVSSDA